MRTGESPILHHVDQGLKKEVDVEMDVLLVKMRP
jgi:hypothetical protein